MPILQYELQGFQDLVHSMREWKGELPPPVDVPKFFAAVPIATLFALFLGCIWWARHRHPPKTSPPVNDLNLPEIQESGTMRGRQLPKIQFPMMVLPIDKAMAIKQLDNHETLREQLIEWRPGMGSAAFFSHTWLRRDHPDSEGGDKAALLVSLLRAMTAGALDVGPHWMMQAAKLEVRVDARALQRVKYVWFDYWSIPQADPGAMRRAIASIFGYATRCDFFVVLAGPWKHEDGTVRDVGAWNGRGWCRLEAGANALSPRKKSLIVAQSPSDVVAHGWAGIAGSSFLETPVGDGAFTVSSDCAKLGPVIAGMIADRLSSALEDGDLEMYRLLRASTRRLLSGCDSTGEYTPREEPLDQWMVSMHFRSVHDGRRSGHTPLRSAVDTGREDLVQELLRRGADVEAPLRKANAAFNFIRGETLLMRACRHRSPPRVIARLLDAGADPTARDEGAGYHCLHYACIVGHIPAMELLTARHPELWNTESNLGTNPLAVLAMFGNWAALQHALQHLHPNASAAVRTVDSAGCSIAMFATFSLKFQVETLRVVLDAGCDVELVGPVENKEIRKARWLTGLVLAFSRQPTQLVEMYGLVVPSPPLYAAAFLGNLAAVEMLLARGARANAAETPSRMTPLHLAALRGHRSIARRLLAAGANVAMLDKWGRTAARVAEQRGHTTLAMELGGGSEEGVLSKLK